MIFDFSELNGSSLEYIDKIGERYKEAVVPFYTDNLEKGNDFNGFGSGFVVKHKGSYFVVTAEHVMSDAKRYGTSAIAFGERKMILEHISVVFHKNRDVAVFCIDKWMKNKGIENLPHITLYKDDSFQSIEGCPYFLLMGYPGTKNRVRDYRRGLNPHLFSITAEQTTPVDKLRTNAESPLYYEFNPKKLVDSFSKKFGSPPDLYGMSGGPAFELVARRPLLMLSVTKVEFSLCFRGVLIEWHKSHKCILSSMNDIVETLVEMSLEEEEKYTSLSSYD